MRPIINESEKIRERITVKEIQLIFENGLWRSREFDPPLRLHIGDTLTIKWKFN